MTLSSKEMAFGLSGGKFVMSHSRKEGIYEPITRTQCTYTRSRSDDQWVGPGVGFISYIDVLILLQCESIPRGRMKIRF